MTQFLRSCTQSKSRRPHAIERLLPALMLFKFRSSTLVLSRRLNHARMSTNSSGLTPEASKQLKERIAQPHEESIVNALKEV